MYAEYLGVCLYQVKLGIGHNGLVCGTWHDFRVCCSLPLWMAHVVCGGNCRSVRSWMGMRKVMR